MMLWAAACFLTLAPAASAQAEAIIREEKKPLKQWIAFLVFSGLVVAIAFKNPKRTHLG